MDIWRDQFLSINKNQIGIEMHSSFLNLTYSYRKYGNKHRALQAMILQKDVNTLPGSL